MARSRYHDVSDPGHVALLASPVRQDIVDTLVALGGEADVAAVAAELGRPADGLYYHFDRLADAGLLQRRDKAGEPRRYRIGTRRGMALRLSYGKRGENSEAVQQVVAKLLQSAGRDFRAALASPKVRTEGEARELWAGRARGWLDEEGLREANALLGRLLELLQGPRQPGQDQLFSLSFVLAPKPGKPARRAKGED
ncbi:MAG: helix-turn-helix domain-containing protein [Arenimonas sp.]|nr:helix-turn-helix domain-containing protein [Arenimonas sp.]